MLKRGTESTTYHNLNCQYHDCWWHGDTSRQDINSHDGIDLVCMKNNPGLHDKGYLCESRHATATMNTVIRSTFVWHHKGTLWMVTHFIVPVWPSVALIPTNAVIALSLHPQLKFSDSLVELESTSVANQRNHQLRNIKQLCGESPSIPPHRGPIKWKWFP